MSIQKCLLDNSSRMIKAMSNAKSSNSEVKTVTVVFFIYFNTVNMQMLTDLGRYISVLHGFVGYL